MSAFYRIAYQVGFHPWEDLADHPPFAATLARLIAREEGGGPPYGRALDVGSGSGVWGVRLAQRGWDVTGVELVAKAVARARKRVAAAGVQMRIVRADVTRLRASDVGSGFRLILDTGTFHGLTEPQRAAMGREITAAAAGDGTVLLDVFAPHRRGPLPRGRPRPISKPRSRHGRSPTSKSPTPTRSRSPSSSNSTNTGTASVASEQVTASQTFISLRGRRARHSAICEPGGRFFRPATRASWCRASYPQSQPRGRPGRRRISSRGRRDQVTKSPCGRRPSVPASPMGEGQAPPPSNRAPMPACLGEPSVQVVSDVVSPSPFHRNANLSRALSRFQHCKRHGVAAERGERGCAGLLVPASDSAAWSLRWPSD